MKHILSFFYASVLLCNYSILFSEESTLDTSYTITSGILFDNEFIETRMFHEFETLPKDAELFVPKTWAVQISPFDFLDLSVGSLSYSGIWSRFNSPAPSIIAPNKQAYSLQNRLIASLPSKTSSEKTLSSTLEISFPQFTLQALSSLQQTKELFAGIGLAVPFSNKEKTVTVNWTLAWKMSRLQAKENDSWFLKSPYFEPAIFHSAIQELSLKTPSMVHLFGMGITQMTHDPIGAFFRVESSFMHKYFLLNWNIFLSDLQYLEHDGGLQRNTIRISINPQFQRILFSGLVRAIKIGSTANIQLQNGESNFMEKKVIASLKVGSDIQLIFLSFYTSASFDNIQLSTKEKEPLLTATEDSIIQFQAKTTFYPWYGDLIQRRWILHSLYEKKTHDREDKGTLDISLSVLLQFPWPSTKNIETALFCSTTIDIENTLPPPSVECGLSIALELEKKISKEDIQALINTQLTINIEEVKTKKIEIDFSLVIKS